MRMNRSGGPSRIRTEHLKGWLEAAKRGGVSEEKGKKKTEAEEEGEEMWGRVVEMTQTAFRDALYSQVPSQGENIPVTVEPAEIDD